VRAGVAIRRCWSARRNKRRPASADPRSLRRVREAIDRWPLERIEQHSGELPGFVGEELRAFTTCGDFEHGFVLAACRRCGEQLRVPFSCKGRGFCPSCLGRRMSEGDALLVDRLLPRCGYRQWVLSFAGNLAVWLGDDGPLLAGVSRCFARAVMSSNHHNLRARIRHDQGQPLPDAPIQVPLFDADGIRPSRAPTSLPPAPASRARIGWAKLLARVFAIDVTVCRRCGGSLRVLAAITDADEIDPHPPRCSAAAPQSHVDQLSSFAE
jgi:hypothetical protein